MRISATNSLAARFPDVAAELAVDLNEGLTADQIIAGSGRRVWWRCANDPLHVWFTKVSHRTHVRSGCPDCTVYGYSTALTGFVYLLGRIDGREQRKIGISNVPRQRTAVHARNGWRLLDLSPALAGAVAFEVEQSFLAVLSASGLRQTHAESAEDRFDGYTEAWPYDRMPMDNLVEVYQTIGWAPDPLLPDQINDAKQKAL
ncbi:zinc-ribbon domain-containing protein [Actinoplanes missouriensis]|uniref:zinc-ribbon domain-containing protein n=1 Tax=Actinoplanes missouriensis TaxID=1866 RepID=UPI003404140D